MSSRTADQSAFATRAAPALVAEPRRLVIAAAAAGAFGGAMLFLDLSLHAFRPLGRAYFVVASIMALCMPLVPATFWLRNLIRPGWRRGLGAAGTALVVLGSVAWFAAFVLLFNKPQFTFTQHLTPGGSALMSFGMLLFGLSVLLSGRLSGPGATLPLLVGVYFPIQLIVQLMFFLNGRDGTPGPNGLILGAWGLVWMAAAWSGATSRARLNDQATAAARQEVL